VGEHQRPTAADRGDIELWLRTNGAPWLVRRRGLVRRAVSDVSGLVAILGFALRWFLTSLIRSRAALVLVLPLLLVAVVLAFFSTEIWQTIGDLHGLPMIVLILLFAGMAAAFVSRQSRPDLTALGTFADETAVRECLPESLRRVPVGDPGAPPTLAKSERLNLVLVSALAQVVAAAVIGAAVAVFFIVLGVLTIDVEVAAVWIGHEPDVWFRFTLAGHEYAMTAQLGRVSVFLGTFAGFYFIVSSVSDERMRDSLSTAHDAHLRTVLAVRSAYRVR
jgi:hypothetical protein